MRYALILLAIVALFTVGGTYLSQHEGEVVIGLSHGKLEMKLWFFIAALVATVIALMIIFKVIWTIIRIPAITRRFGKKRVGLRAGDLLQKGMLAMGKGQWKKAENHLVKGARLSYKAGQNPGLFLTNAAEAAQHLGAEERRNQYLLEARQLSAEGIDNFSAALSEARLHLEVGEAEKALECVSGHLTSHAHNPQLIVLQSDAYEKLGDYRHVWDLLPSIRKQFPDKARYQARQIEVATALFNDSKSTEGDIEKVWSELPKTAKNDESLFLNYISGLINAGQEEKAEDLLARAIRKDFSDPIVHAYTQLDVGSSAVRLNKVNAWLRSRPDNAYLNYGAAKLAFECEQFEKARDYAKSSIQYQPLPETFALLGKIYEALGESQNALLAYKGSVGLTYADKPQAVSGEVLPTADVTALPSGGSVTEDNAKALVNRMDNEVSAEPVATAAVGKVDNSTNTAVEKNA